MYVLPLILVRFRPFVYTCIRQNNNKRAYFPLTLVFGLWSLLFGVLPLFNFKFMDFGKFPSVYLGRTWPS